MNNITILVLSFITSLSLSSCYEIHTNTEYSNDFRQAYVTSKPIYISFKNDSNNRIYLLLEKNMNSEDYFIRVRWEYKNKVRQFKGMDSTLKFFIDNQFIYTETPIKPIKTVSLNIDTNRLTEEAVYHIDKELITKIANAKSVEISIDGKYENKLAHFNKTHTFRAFKDFLKNSL